MKKNFWKTSKKVLSVFLSVLMLMSAWVFVPGEHDHAHAIDAGDAVTAYNKELLNQIKTDPDTNMVTTTNNKYKRTDNGKLGDTNSNVTSTHLSNSYQNVLNFNNGNIVTSGTGAAATFTGVTNADSVKVWYPDTVLMYDGGKAKMAVLLEVDSNGTSLRASSCWISGNANGLYVGFDESNPYWRGHSDDDPAVMYCLWIGSTGYYMTSDGSLHSSYKYGCTGWSFHASHIYFNGTMSDTEWVRAINPQWSFKGGSSDTQQWGPVTANGHTIYVMNIQGYKRLVQDIISKKGTLNGKEGQYTRDSLQRFVNACNKITKDLAPKNFVSTTSNNVTSWASQMSTAYTELNNAYNGLTKRNVNVGYENLFSISDWAQSLSPNLQSSSSVEIAVENNDTVKIYKNSAGGEVTTGSSYPNAHVATRYSIPVTGGKDYTVRYDIEASVNGTAQSEVFMFWYDANNNPVNNTAGSATFNNKGFGSTGACSVTFTAPASATKAEIRFDNDCPSSGSTLRFKNIAVYPAERNTAVEVDSWSTRPVMKTVQYGSTLSGKLAVPVRNGYTFNGWYIDNVNVNGVKDSGEEVTDAAGNVIKSVTVTNSINLYADWAPLPMDIGYDNIFSLAEWAKTNSTKASSTNGTIAYDVMAGTITAESTANGEVYTNYGTGADQYVIAVEPNTEYIFEADMDLVTGDKGQMFVFFYNASGSGVSGAIYNGAAQTNTHIGIYPTTEGTSSITFTTPANCTKLAFRVGATNVGTKAVYSNIGLYNKADYDAYAKDYATIRVPFNFGDTTQLSLVPVRAGYKFEGWFKADGTQLTSVDGLKASDTVYAKWAQMFTVTFKNWNGDVIKTQEVAPGANATAPANPVKDPDTNTEYVFDKWDTAFTNVQSDLTVTAVFKTKDHSLVKSYVSGSTCTTAATYTQYCTSCNFTWNGVLEDAGMPALGHTYDRDPATFTVITGTSTGGKDTDLHTIKCNECDATKTVVHNFQLDAAHPAVTATCTVKGETYYKCACLATKTVTGTTNPDIHVNTEIRDAKDAKCGVEGYTGDTYCNDCKKTIATGTVIKALEHKYTNYVYNDDATCTADGTKTATCDNGCGTKDTIKAEGTMIPHSFTNYESNGDATCDADGTKTAKCDYGCNVGVDTVTDVGSKREHNFETLISVTENNNGTHTYKYECAYDDCDATTTATEDCTYGAWTTDNATTHSHTCTICDYTPAAEAHDWSAWTTVGGSGTEKATQTRSCNVCGKVENTECNYAVKDHKDATCEAAELTTYKCSDCGHGYTVIGTGPKGHQFDAEKGVKDNGNGTHSFACKNGCGEYGFETTKNMSIPCSDWTYANTEAGKHTATCKDCGYVKTVDCSGGKATCTAQAVCEFCNTAYGKLADHNYDGNTYFEGVEKAKDATCTAQAEYYTYCSACKKSSKGTDKEATFAYGDLLAHTYTGDTEYLYKAEDAKCEVNETYYTYCSACKASSKGTAEEATFEKADTALDHVWVNAQHNADTLTHTFTCERDCGATMTANCENSAITYGLEQPTCTEQGYTTVQCTACNHTWNINYTDALGHNYTQKIYDEAHLRSAADCYAAATYWYDCSRCDKNAKEETDAAYDILYFSSGNARTHAMQNKIDDAYLAEAATCTASAKYYPSCSYEGCGYFDTNNIFSSGTKPLGHDFTEMIQDEAHFISAADCVNGSKYYYDCSRCDENAKDDKEKDKYTYELKDFSGHSMTYTAAKAATCDAKGNYEYWYCSNCKKYYKDADGAEAYAGLSATEIAKREHNYVYVAYKAPTCEVDGNPDYRYCSYEDCSYTTISTYKATGHNFSGAYTFDSVHNQHSKLCLNGCGKSGIGTEEYKVTYDGLDYVFEGSEACVFNYVAETKNGVHTHSNSCVCGNNTTKTYSDNETFVETVAATCTTGGYDQHACPDCGQTWKKNVVAAGQHKPADKATSNGDGTHSIYCTVEGCGARISTAKCSGGTATCSAQAICEVCNTAYGATGDHVLAADGWTSNNDATCSAAGTKSQICTACNQTVTVADKGSKPLGHSMINGVFEAPEKLADALEAANIVLKASTCAEEGLSLNYCERCDYYTTKIVPKDKSNHSYGEWDAVGGDCATGVTYKKTCTLCGDFETKVESKEHTWEDVIVVESTCQAKGYKYQKCADCSFTQTIYDENMGDHQFVDVETYEEATCCNPAYNVVTATCKLCGETKEPVKTAVEGSVALGHTEENLVKWYANPATCDVAGYVEHYRGSCGSYFVLVDGEFVEKDWSEIQYVLGHNFVDGVCSRCSAIKDGNSAHSCICHKTSGFMKFIYKILRFFWKLFKINAVCSCGVAHY